MSRLTRLLRVAAGCCLLALAVISQTRLEAQTTGFTQITSSKIKLGGFTIPTGTVTFTAVDLNGISLAAFADGGGGQDGGFSYQCQITNGVIGGLLQANGTTYGAAGTCLIPDSALTVPANIHYTIQVCDVSTGLLSSGKCYTLQSVPGITGTTWALDHYGPPAATSNVQTVQFQQGASTPTSCIAPYFFTNTTTSVSYTCVAGVYVQIAYGGASPVGSNINQATNSGGTAFIPATPVTSYNATLVTPATGQNYTTLYGTSFLTPTVPATPGVNNVVIGPQAGAALNGTGDQYGGQGNVIVGEGAYQHATTARESVIIGNQAGYLITGNGLNTPDDNINVMIGSLAGSSLTDSEASVLIGQKALETATQSLGDTVIGVHSGTGLSGTSAHNTLVGSGVFNTAGGQTVTNSVLVGANAGVNATAGTTSNNTGVGVYSLAYLAAGATDNVAMGYQAGGNISSGTFNVFLGDEIHVPSAATTGSYNVKIGNNANTNLTSGGFNTLINADGSAPLSTGSYNVEIGTPGGGSITSGSYNILIGATAGQHMLGTAVSNVLIGRGAGGSTIDSNGVDIGVNAGVSNNAGTQNTYIGGNAGSYNTGSGNTVLGYNAMTSFADASSNDEVIGAGAQTGSAVSNSIQIGAGTNATSNTVQFNGFNLFNTSTGKITPTSLSVASARKGTFVCTAGGTITVANTNELTTSDVIISLNTAGGTITTAPAMKTVTAGTGFTVLCGATDTSTYNYTILN